MQSSSPPSPGPARRRVCLFGGSFDPVHLGHTALAAAAHDRCGLERIVFLPARQSPHKLDQPPPASPEHRLAMLHLAVADFPWAEVSRWEIDRPGPSYSWQTAEHFSRTAGPDTELCWLLGADQWASLPSWAHPDRLAQLLTFLVFPRGPAPIVPRPGFRHEIIDLRHPASATAARAAARAGQPLDELLDARVAAYVRRHALYREKAAPPSSR